MSSAEGMCLSGHRPSGLSVFYSKAWFELWTFAQWSSWGATGCCWGWALGDLPPVPASL